MKILLCIISLAITSVAYAASPKPVSKVVVEGTEYPVYEYYTGVKAQKQKSPVYPHKARQEGRGGHTLVGAVVDEKGKIAATFVAKSTADEDIQQAACAAVKQWRFPKLKEAEKPISYVVFVPILMSP